MSKLQDRAIERAKQFRQQLGGTIFAFPIEEENPFSAYSVVMYADKKYFSYPDATDISMAAAGVLIILEELKKIGQDADYKRNVRLISHQAQMDAPSTVMHRLKKENVSKPIYKEEDVSEGSEETGQLISARGVLKFSYLAMVDDKLPKAAEFLDEYYKLLAMRKYGKTAAAIKQEVRKMGKDQAIDWIEQTYKKYIHDDMEIMNIFADLKGKKV
jgi:hypothetical protein